jgi:hypothetical protein
MARWHPIEEADDAVRPRRPVPHPLRRSAVPTGPGAIGAQILGAVTSATTWLELLAG